MLQKMQLCQLEILKQFEKVCSANHLRFYLAFGTCLGAIRHHGFIPWDDDIDVFMRVDDLNKLISLQNQFPSNLFLQTHEIEPGFGLPIARVRDSSTTLIEADHVNRDINHGVYIDIYPLFYCKENNVGFRISVIESFICRLFTYKAPPQNKGTFSVFISKVLLYIFPNVAKERIAKHFYQKLISQKKTSYLSNFPDISQGKRYLDKWFGEPVMSDFEGLKMPLPTSASEFLTYYFHDYMQLPPEAERQVHHQYLFADFHNSYLKYKGIEYCKKK